MGIVSLKSKLNKQSLVPKVGKKHIPQKLGIRDHKTIATRLDVTKDFKHGYTLYLENNCLYLIGHRSTYETKQRIKVLMGQVIDRKFIISPTLLQPIGNFDDRLDLLSRYYGQARQTFLNKCISFARSH